MAQLWVRVPLQTECLLSFVTYLLPDIGAITRILYKLYPVYSIVLNHPYMCEVNVLPEYL